MKITDPVSNISTSHEIPANRSLTLGKYRVYPEGVQEAPGGRPLTALRVVYDPGRTCKLAGGMLACCGLVTLLVTRLPVTRRRLP